MAELELRVRCKTLPNRIGFGVMVVLFPIWSLIVPTCLGLFTQALLQNPSMCTPLAMMFLLGLALFPICCVLLTAFFEDDRLNVSKDGITFPLFLSGKLKFRRNRTWGELTSASLQRSSSGKDRLNMQLQSGESLTLPVNSFSKSDMEQMLLALELWGTNCSRAPELVDYQNRLQNENTGVGGKSSYTQMWEEELSRRFNATAFVPLEPEHKLKGGQLEIVRQIAFGGLSAIYQAQRNNKDMVVIKEAVVPPSADPQTRRKAEELFVREAELLVKLRHPHIAHVYDHFVEDGRNYLMLEYINGQDLRQYVKQNGPQSEALVLDWAIQIADVLKYLHSQEPPIIHRDLTPDNLVLRNDGSVVLIDFGAANEFVGTATGTLVGKQAYIAPEQLRGKSSLQSDLYSFGGTLYFLLVGKDPLPLSESNPRAAGCSISHELEKLILELTAFDHKKRIQSVAELAPRLEALRSIVDPEADTRPRAMLGGGV